MLSATELFQRTLKHNNYSVTQPRLLVFEALEDEEPLSIAELQMKLEGMVDRASIYRTVSLFEKLGIIQRLQLGWKFKIELLDAFNFHHHHITCRSCEMTIPIHEDVTLEASIKTLGKEYGFSETNHQIEILGLCPICQKT